MKVKLLKDTKIGGYSYKKGTQLEVDLSTGESLIDKKIAIAEDFVTLSEQHAEKVSEKKAEEILENLQTDAKKLINSIKNIVNVPALEHLLNDARISVRDAASKRLEQLQ